MVNMRRQMVRSHASPYVAHGTSACVALSWHCAPEFAVTALGQDALVVPSIAKSGAMGARVASYKVGGVAAIEWGDGWETADS
jgi:hypothetical protein